MSMIEALESEQEPATSPALGLSVSPHLSSTSESSAREERSTKSEISATDKKELKKLLSQNKKLRQECLEKDKAFDTIVRENYSRVAHVYDTFKESTDSAVAIIHSNFADLVKANTCNFEQLSKTNESFFREYATLQQSKVGTLSDTITHLQTELDSTKETLIQKAAEIIELRTIISDLQTQLLKQIKNDLIIKEQEIALFHLTELLQSKETVISEHLDQLKSLQEQLFASESALKSTSTVLTNLERDYQDVQVRLNELQSKFSQILVNNQAKVVQIDSQALEIITLKNGTVDLENKLVVCERTIDEKGKLVADLASQLDKLTCTVIDHKNTINTLVIEAKTRENELVLEKREHEQVRAKLSKLELGLSDQIRQSNDMHTAEIERIKAEFEKRKKTLEIELEEKIAKVENSKITKLAEYEKRITILNSRLTSSIDMESLTRMDIESITSEKNKYKNELRDIEKMLSKVGLDHKRDIEAIKTQHVNRFENMLEEKNESERKLKASNIELMDKLDRTTKVLDMTKGSLVEAGKEKEDVLKKFNTKSSEYNSLLERFGQLRSENKHLADQLQESQTENDDFRKMINKQSGQISDMAEQLELHVSGPVSQAPNPGQRNGRLDRKGGSRSRNL